MKTIIIGAGHLSAQVNERIVNFAEEKEIKVEKLNPFGTEPIYISSPERKFREEIQNIKFFDKPKSKFYK